MQKQYSNNDCTEDKYSIYSKSGRKLSRRINNNIRVLNKSKVSSRSNNSIGSVALRRTQLSNDKIYSRQEQFVPLNSSQVGLDFQSIYEKTTSKKSIPMTPIQSNDNYRQRIKQPMSHRSSRADSQRSDTNKYSKYKKINRQDIQKLYLLQSNNRPNVQKQRIQRSNSKKSSQRDPRSPKESIRMSRNNQEKKYDYNQIKSIRSIKSSLKSQLKSPSSKNLKQRKNYPQNYNQNNAYEIKKLSQKYLKPSYAKLNDDRNNQRVNLQQQNSRSKRKRYEQNQDQQAYNKRRVLQKYQSQKVLPNFQDQPYSKYLKNGRKKDKYYEQDSINKQYQRYYLQKNRKQNQYKESYQRRYKNQQFKNDDSIEQEKTLKKQYRKYRPEKKSQRGQHNDYYQNRDRKYRKQNYSSKNSVNYYSHQRSSILDLRSKHNRSKMRNIRIRQEQYGHLYENDQYNNSGNNRNDKSKDRYSRNYEQKKYKKSNYPQNHQYYDHLNSKNHHYDNPHQNERRTQISQTFDSLMLSLNSRVTASNSLNSIQIIIEKIKLHFNTLNLIADYTHEFKKMYEQIDLWEQLIFLAYKKFWVQRTKAYNFIKKFKKHKRHQSQRMGSSNSKRNILGHKISTMKNIGSQNYKKQSQNAFDDMDLQQNPFIIPFCKITQEQIKQLVKTQEGSVLLLQIQKQNQSSYKSLQQMYNFIIEKSGNHINMHFCDNFSDDIYILMLEQIEQLIPNLQQFSVFEATKIRLGKIVKAGILILFLNGKYIRNISEIITYDDLQKIGNKKKIKMYTTYDLYYEVLESLVAE